MAFYSNFLRWLGGGGTTRNRGAQSGAPSSNATTLGPVSTETALQLSTVWACVRLISEAVAGLPIRFYSVSEKGIRTPNPGHKLARLLSSKPNRYQTIVEFIETITLDLCLHGNCYCLIGRAGKEVVSLLPLMAQQVEVELMSDGTLVYKYTESEGVKVFAGANIWHVKLMGNGIVGLSPLAHARSALGIAIANEKRVANMAQRGFKPAGVLMIDKLLKADQREQIRAQFADLQTGDGDPLKVLEAGMTYQQISMNPKDVQLLESRHFQVEDLCRFFGVPSVLVNHTGATTTLGSGIDQIIQGFYKFTLRPYLERYEASIRNNLLPIEERHTVDVEFDFYALLRGDDERRYTAQAKAVQGGLRTPDEVRALDGYGPMPGGDRLFLQAQMTPVEDLPVSSGAATPPPGKTDDDETGKDAL
jgi:HK97 family phage portal protein